ncbi:hypothetical protein P1X15_29760 [Runella sp. MFBS21]|uniref:hypothetical protein n=1 Tax=Runella sp. MFBS21 TaxID=3034018 RepID=UPI0023FA48AC|nr:hypothetical protein [Runella sp. MFBS21]MDF7821839.1 hypothetical protein [Runella sp. MFBS21]
MKNITLEYRKELIERRRQLQLKHWVNHTLQNYNYIIEKLNQNAVDYQLYLGNHPFEADNTNYELYAGHGLYWRWVDKHFPTQYNGINWREVPEAVYLDHNELRYRDNLPAILTKLTQQYTIEDTEVCIFWGYLTGGGPTPSFRIKWSDFVLYSDIFDYYHYTFVISETANYALQTLFDEAWWGRADSDHVKI